MRKIIVVIVAIMWNPASGDTTVSSISTKPQCRADIEVNLDNASSLGFVVAVTPHVEAAGGEARYGVLVTIEAPSSKGDYKLGSIEHTMLKRQRSLKWLDFPENNPVEYFVNEQDLPYLCVDVIYYDSKSKSGCFSVYWFQPVQSDSIPDRTCSLQSLIAVE